MGNEEADICNQLTTGNLRAGENRTTADKHLADNLRASEKQTTLGRSLADSGKANRTFVNKCQKNDYDQVGSAQPRASARLATVGETE